MQLRLERRAIRLVWHTQIRHLSPRPVCRLDAGELFEGSFNYYLQAVADFSTSAPFEFGANHVREEIAAIEMAGRKGLDLQAFQSERQQVRETDSLSDGDAQILGRELAYGFLPQRVHRSHQV